MISKDKLVKVVNKFGGVVGYDVPDTNIHRNYAPNQVREVTYDELEKVFYTPGGEIILKDYLEIQDEDAIEALFAAPVEPEYHYDRKDIEALLTTGTLDQFLDCLDFAPEVTKEIIKDIAVELPLNDMAKRKAIQDKLGFNVTKAIEIKEMKFDSETMEAETEKTGARRAAPIKTSAAAPAATGRRYKPAPKE
jgi:hypothetical protein